MKPTKKKNIFEEPNIELDQEIVPKKKNPIGKILTVLFGFIFFIIIILLTYSGWYLQSFSDSAETTPKEIVTSIKQGITSNPFENQPDLNILLLGKDDFGEGRSGSILTDTIILISIHQSGSITLLPFPRDLWIDPLKSKINALYYYGEESEDITGSDLVAKTIEEISNISLDHIIVINLGLLEEVIDILGGIQIDVDTAFVDDKYPNSQVAPDILPIELRYETISFESGPQQMDGATAIKYIRSRQSSNQDENTDNARSLRQQKVITAIVNQISSNSVIFNPQVMGNLYKFWKNDTQTSISDKELISLTKEIINQPISFQSISIPIQTINEKGILYNPPLYKYNQWVYVPYDSSWTELQEYILKNLHQCE